MSHERNLSQTRKRSTSLLNSTNIDVPNNKYNFGIQDLNTGLYYQPHYDKIPTIEEYLK